ncbi:LysR family transcriptional regulator [Kocuria sp.]|uniref:LysR family transcriptional regulator n=1 Tax=Kocuria sp. TaxID=1871328 RepID=UPI0026E0091B|nr:LysR substrate-binding domain-containing protein [Kocuria sp.]MDO5617593.1 LysR substrate-binding domain-containing protein [Kocuria sp.]
MLNLNRLRMLSELKRRGTLAEVARVLSYTPSAVSQQLALLEREAGVALLERVGRGVHLTDAGESLVGHADAVLARLERAQADLDATKSEVQGVLRVASFQTVVMTLMPTALSLLAERHPLLQVEITQRVLDRAYDGLLSLEFDLIVGEELPGFPVAPRPGSDRVELIQDPQVLALPDVGRFSTRVADLGELAQTPWALDAADTQMGVWSRSLCRAAGYEPRIILDSPDPLLQLHMVRTGHAAAFVHGLVGSQYTGGIQLIALPDGPHRKIFTSVRASRTHHPAITAFREAMAQAARQAGSATGDRATVLMPEVSYSLGALTSQSSDTRSH